VEVYDANAALCTLPLDLTSGSGFVMFYTTTDFIIVSTKEAIEVETTFCRVMFPHAHLKLP
jgi:hypothetical protein